MGLHRGTHRVLEQLEQDVVEVEEDGPPEAKKQVGPRTCDLIEYFSNLEQLYLPDCKDMVLTSW